jgi:predicted anti-sigma-YlaC factor YlaD
VNPTKNNNDAHERARRLIALATPETLSVGRLSDNLSDQASSNAWLATHLETCASCRAFAENAAETIHRLRAIPVAADRSLVSTTQRMVRRRALELQRQRERMWLVAVSCTAVTICALLSTVALWLGFEWLGARAQLASSVWQVGFLVFCVMPALVVAIMLLAEDKDNYKHLADHTGSYQG